MSRGTTGELLEIVNAAIRARLDGPAGVDDSVGATALKLADLINLRDQLQAELSAQNRGGVSYADMSRQVE